MPPTSVAFNVLRLDEESAVVLSNGEHRGLLEGLGLHTDGWGPTACAFDGHSSDLMSACDELGLEGMVAKRTDRTGRGSGPRAG
ncbi:MAG: hypothetical protein NVS3B21_25380 [Acidimicrobiales bacterium]